MREKHIHRYRRVDIGKGKKETWIMQCSLPKCDFYTLMKTRVSCPSLIGKLAICNRCNDIFALDRRALRQAKPSCDNCTKSKNEADLDKASKFFSSIEKEILEG